MKTCKHKVGKGWTEYGKEWTQYGLSMSKDGAISIQYAYSVVFSSKKLIFHIAQVVFWIGCLMRRG